MEKHGGSIFLAHGKELWLAASFRWTAVEKKRCLTINVGERINGETKLIAEKIFSAFQPSEQCTPVSIHARFLCALIMDGEQCLGAIYLDMTPATALTSEFKRLFYKTVNILSDLLQQEFARYRLEDSKAKYRLLTNNTPMGILIHIDGAVVYLNKTMCMMLGAQSSEEIIGHQLVDFIVPSGQGETYYAENLLQGDQLEVLEDRLFRLDGSSFWAEIRSVATEFNEQPAVQVHIDNIDTRKKAVEDLARLSYYDELTGLPNRRLFSDRVEQAIAMARREKQMLALLYLDLNRFKTINDTLGHRHGDLVLKEIGRRLHALIHPSYTAARMGGDEFAVLISGSRGVTDKVATQVAYDLSDAIKQPFQLGEQQLVLDASIGIVIFPRDGETMEILFKHVDSAMYSAKRSATNVLYFSSAMEEQVVRRLLLEQELAKVTDIYRRRSNWLTLHNNEQSRPPFQLRYQAKHRLSDNVIIGVEALIRWQHAELGFIPPAEFIPLAEDMGVMRPITYAILAEAAKQAVIWEEANIRPPHIGINLSAVQLIQVDLVQAILLQIKKAGAQPEWFEIEITETAAMREPEIAIQIMTQLVDLGIEIAIDDFGTGYSSLAYLKRLPAQWLKIDIAFIRDLPQDENSVVIVRAIIAMSHALGMQVIAEGVESQAQYEFLRNEGCDAVQGYFFSKALSRDQSTDYLTRNISKQIYQAN